MAIIHAVEDSEALFCRQSHAAVQEPYWGPSNIALKIPGISLRTFLVGFSGWVLDRAYDDVVQVDLATGVRTLVVDTVGGGLPISFGLRGCFRLFAARAVILTLF